MKSKTKDHLIALTFFVLTILFIAVAMTNISFFDWVFDRHHNQWNWYIRPVFIIPFCYLAYKRSLSGVAISIFCLFSSMFLFEKPDIIDNKWLNFFDLKKSDYKVLGIIIYTRLS